MLENGGIILDKSPIIGSLLLGFAGSLCCGGTLLFGSIGLGALWGTLGMWRYIPEALATGTVLITLLNWLYYRRKAARRLTAGCEGESLRSAALISGFLGLTMMAASFIFLEWLNHGVLHPRPLSHAPDMAGAVIAGVRNSHLWYVAATFLALPVLAVLPLPQKTKARGHQQSASSGK